MSNERDVEILALIERLSNEINTAKKHSLDVTVRLLETAILDLRALAFSISDDELRSFTDALEETLFNSKLSGSYH